MNIGPDVEMMIWDRCRSRDSQTEGRGPKRLDSGTKNVVKFSMQMDIAATQCIAYNKNENFWNNDDSSPIKIN